MSNKDSFARTKKRSVMIFVAVLFSALLVALTLGNTSSPVDAQGGPYTLAACPTVIPQSWRIKGNCGTIAGTNFLGTTDNQPLVIKTNGTERMQIGESGNVGIATTNPMRLLQIGNTDVSGIGFDKSDSSPNAGYIRFGDNTGWKLHLGRSRESNGGPLNTGTTGVLMTLQDNGNVGIGTTSPAAKTEIDVPAEGTRALRLMSGPNAYLDITPTNTGGRFQTVLDTVNSRDIVLLPHASNVGIGTTSPQSTLQVVGNYIQFPTIFGAPPPAGDCNAASEAGRVVVRTDGTTNLYVCTGAGGWVGK